MPRVDEGWYIVPIEALIRANVSDFSWSSVCGCILVDEPFNTIVEVGGKRLPVAIGSGSLVCRPECREEIPVQVYRLATPAWARGVTLDVNECPGMGDEELLSLISRLTGLEVVEAKASEILAEGGVALHPRSLDLEPLEGGCGRARALLPTHPLAALLASEPEACVESIVEPVRGGRWWGGVPLASIRLGGRGPNPVLAYRYGVIRGYRPEALLLTARPKEGSVLLAAYALGALHACGRAER